VQVVTSSLGKKMIKDFVSPDGHAFVNLLKQILVKMESGNASKGEEFETLLLKWGVEILMRIQDKRIGKERVLMTRDPIFQLWSDALDMLEISWVFDESRLVLALHAAWAAITALSVEALEVTYVTPLHAFVDRFMQMDFVVRFYTAPEWSRERHDMRVLLRRVWDNTFGDNAS